MFDVYVTDIESGEETLAIMGVYATAQRDAIEVTRKLLKGSPLLRKITHVAFTAVEVDNAETDR